MNNLTATILSSHNKLQVEEWTKQGDNIEFNSGKGQRIVNSSIPSITMQVSYSKLSFNQFTDLRQAYENNHSNTVIIDATEIHDIRPDLMGINSSVWAIQQFKFSVTSDLRYTGTIKLVSSVFFNYPIYQEQFSESSSYTPVPSEDTAFEALLNAIRPYAVSYEYMSNSIFSRIGSSGKHIRDKGGLRKKWKLSWFLQESSFLKLLKFYRQKSGIMGTFGIPAEGSTGISVEEYMSNSSDYIASDYFVDLDENLTKAIFLNDSIKYTKRVDNMYMCQVDIVEVLH